MRMCYETRELKRPLRAAGETYKLILCWTQINQSMKQSSYEVVIAYKSIPAFACDNTNWAASLQLNTFLFVLIGGIQCCARCYICWDFKFDTNFKMFHHFVFQKSGAWKAIHNKLMSVFGTYCSSSLSPKF